MLDQDRCYSAVCRRDPGADGLFFVAVRTTHIYCRPICPARTPFRANVVFFQTAAEAQSAGYRPCFRCRPESAPDSPAWIGSLATVNRALKLIDGGELVDSSVAALAERLGVTDRHLRRLFMRRLGVGPVEIERTRRVHLAKKLIHETHLSMAQIAFAAGFGSVRRFNEVLTKVMGCAPNRLRRNPSAQSSGEAIELSLAFRPPLTFADISRRLNPLADGRQGLTIRIRERELQIPVAPKRQHTLLLQLPNDAVADLAVLLNKTKALLLSDLRRDDSAVSEAYAVSNNN
jgi:AraC family transcriptional regulator of adaptative response / DNA-3-methyladenine glycosylase II